MGEKREEALGIIHNMLSPDLTAQMKEGPYANFGKSLSEFALNHVFEPLWADKTLDLRTRSLITLAMLIALRADDEMHVHFPAAIRNGATLQELEQVIYQATGYAGFPAANTARNIAISSLRRAGFLTEANGE